MIETLVGYARDGNFDEFRKLLYREPDLLEQTAESGESPLIAALYNGRMEIVDYLLDKGITVTIHEAAALGDDQSVRWLLDYEPLLIGVYSFDGWTPLHLAAFFGASEAVSLLLERGAHIEAVSQNHLQNTALHAATAAKRSAVVLTLLQAGADANARQKNGQTALHQAVENYDINMVQMLLDFRADASLNDGRGMSAVRLAERLGYAEILQMLERHESTSEGQAFKGQIVYLHNFFLPELNALRTLRIYLPPGYEQSDVQYPVLYMHDGQNLFEKQTSSYGMCWDIATTIDEWVEQGRHPGFIVVGIDNNREGIGRYHEYSPWESEIVKQYLEKASHEQRVGGDGFAYLDCIVHTIKPYIDKHYRTQNEKENTLIGGSSMGGYISISAAFVYGDVFGKVLACSTAVFFEEKELAAYIEMQPKSAGQRIYMDIGTNETSNSKLAHFPAIYSGSNERMYQLLQSKGFVTDVDVRYVIEDNAEHNETAWALRFPAAVEWLFAEQFK